MRDEEVEHAAAANVANGNPHARVGIAHRRISGTTGDGVIGERAVPVIDPQTVRLPVVGDEDIRPAVAVKIGADHPQAWARDTANAGSKTDIFKANARGRLTGLCRLRAEVVKKSAAP